MHTFVGARGTMFHFNGDFSGDVLIDGKPVPVIDLIALVARHYVIPRRISALEDGADNATLGVK